MQGKGQHIFQDQFRENTTGYTTTSQEADTRRGTKDRAQQSQIQLHFLPSIHIDSLDPLLQHLGDDF